MANLLGAADNKLSHPPVTLCKQADRAFND